MLNKKTQKKLAFILLCLCVFINFSCIYNNLSTQFDFTITSPLQNWNYLEDRFVLLSTNVKSNEIIWNSSIDGNLGKGNGLKVYLTPGNHVISARYKTYQKRIEVYVSSKTDTDRITKTLINSLPFSKKMDSGNLLSYLVAANTLVKNVTVSKIDNERATSKTELNQMSVIESMKKLKEHNNIQPFRDFSVTYNKKSKTMNVMNSKSVNKNSEIIDKKQFYVVNTENQMNEPHYLNATKYYSSDDLSVWICNDDFEILNIEMLNSIIFNVETIIIPRVNIIWGKCEDINKDGTFSLLLSSTINKENTAIGFFNPQDFFVNNKDLKDEAYNPYSNEMDVLYVALPEKDTNNYSVNSIIATIAHELTHAINFTNKTYKRIKNGETNVLQEEVFLDEGLSHLTENLCGFGISGGNIDFFRKYLSSPSDFSFCKENISGQNDCAGQRGAMTLFLSWLFCKAGGMKYDLTNQIYLIDKGGISFLQRIIADEEVGWSTIGKAFGKSTDALFFEMIEQIMISEMYNETYNSIFDPITNEPVDFFVNMNINSLKNYAGFPKQNNNSERFIILPFSINPIQKEKIKSETTIQINGEYEDGTLFMFSVIADSTKN